MRSLTLMTAYCQRAGGSSSTRNADFSPTIGDSNITNYFLHFRVISILRYHLRL